jgi:GNAT superfamily N-acetyltransferase
MTPAAWHEEAIARKHNRDDFDCGEAELNDFLVRHARRSHEQGAAKTFLAIRDDDGKSILGFYSLAPATLSYASTPGIVRKGLVQHEVPGFRLARLATDRRVQGQALGGILLMAAGRHCLRAAAEVGGVMLVIDAKNDRAAHWYQSYGAIPLADTPASLVLPLATIRQALPTE